MYYERQFIWKFKDTSIMLHLGCEKNKMVNYDSSSRTLSLSTHRAAGRWLKVGSGSEHDVKMLRTAARDAVTLPHSPGTALTPPPEQVMSWVRGERFYYDDDLLEHLAGQVAAQQSGFPSNCLHRAGHSPQKAFSWQSASHFPCLISQIY